MLFRFSSISHTRFFTCREAHDVEYLQGKTQGNGLSPQCKLLRTIFCLYMQGFQRGLSGKLVEPLINKLRSGEVHKSTTNRLENCNIMRM